MKSLSKVWNDCLLCGKELYYSSLTETISCYDIVTRDAHYLVALGKKGSIYHDVAI